MMAGTARFAVLAVLAVAANGQVLADTWRSADQPNSLEFATAYDDQGLTGRFNRFGVRLQTANGESDPEALTVEVDTGSADMNDTELNAELAGADWFDSKAHPSAVFVSHTIERTPTDRWRAPGLLRLKGLERPVTVVFSWKAQGDAAELEGQAELSRADWKIGTGEWSGEEHIPDAVQLRFQVSLRRQD